MKDKSRVGICLDTCHSHAAGESELEERFSCRIKQSAAMKMILELQDLPYEERAAALNPGKEMKERR